MDKEYTGAIEYIRKNKTWSEAEENAALEHIAAMRCDIRHASEKIANEIRDLMDEWATIYLPYPDLWVLELSEDDIFFEL